MGKTETVEARQLRLARARAERLAREHYGLGREQREAADALTADTVTLLTDMAMLDGMCIGRPGREIAKLANIGFIEIRRANGHASIAKLTPDGLKALISRLVKR
jgi:hypothetical protein